MERTVKVKVEPLTEAAFRPFGQLISLSDRPPDIEGVNSDSWKSSFEADGPTLVMLISSRNEGLRFTRLERHLGVTQTFIPLGQVPAVIAVAAPTTTDNPAAIPAPEDVHGFLIDGSAGYLLKRGTWHSLDRYPLSEQASQIVIITDHRTQKEIEHTPLDQWHLTQNVDYATRFGITFEIVRP
jgi:ureidoglycolate hydrolase